MVAGLGNYDVCRYIWSSTTGRDKRKKEAFASVILEKIRSQVTARAIVCSNTQDSMLSSRSPQIYRTL